MKRIYFGLSCLSISLFSITANANQPFFNMADIAKCKLTEPKLWNCVPDYADMTLEDGTYIREASPDLLECKAGVCINSESQPAGHASKDGSYYVLGGWQLILDGEYAAYPTSLPVTDTNEIDDYQFPAVAFLGQDIRDFVPWGWKVFSYAKGHLNNDGHEDIALILQSDDVRYQVKEDETSLDLNPRLLVVLLSNQGQGYRKLVQNNQFIPVALDSATMEPFGAIGIKNGLLEMSFTNERSMGSWSSSSDKFRFAYVNDEMLLQDYQYSETARNTGEIKEVHVDYTTGKKEVKIGNIESDQSTVTTTPIQFNVSPNLNSIFTPANEFYSMYSVRF